MHVTQPVKTPLGTMTPSLPLVKWRRLDGKASFVCDLIALRKTLLLCHGCVVTHFPAHWQQQYDYECVPAFHGDGGCDYCRQEGPADLYVAGEGAYWQEWEASTRIIRQVRERECRLMAQDSRYLIGV